MDTVTHIVYAYRYGRNATNVKWLCFKTDHFITFTLRKQKQANKGLCIREITLKYNEYKSSRCHVDLLGNHIMSRLYNKIVQTVFAC